MVSSETHFNSQLYSQTKTLRKYLVTFHFLGFLQKKGTILITTIRHIMFIYMLFYLHGT